MIHRRRLACALLAVLAPLSCVWGATRPVTALPQFVGSASCTSCHAAQAAAWQGSHHAQAMQVADEHSVLGDFSGTAPAARDGVQRFFERDGKYFATIQMSGQAPQDLQIRYTFGVYPLQQYLVAGPRGRLQALGTAWDARPVSAGGQRWYPLHPEGTAPDDPLHWSGRDSNWNFMCAACHSTNLRKNYSAAEDRYRTTWSDLSVACEACHGPGSNHLRWAHSGAAPASDKGLTVGLQATRTVQWGFWSAAQRIASPKGAQADARAQAQVCFPCHARRQALTDGGKAGQELLDDYLPQLIEPGVYRADGQIEAEDFEFGSFVQSRMYGQGVTCTNCHDAHTLQLRASGNAVCTQCHRAEVFDRPAHSHHAAGTAGAQCVGCHMPARTYMGVDARRDHGFRVPRPDLTQTIGVPNACATCHQNQPAGWAVKAVRAWGQAPAPTTDFAAAIDAAWTGAPATDQLLRVLAATPTYSSMVRASAAALINVPDGSPSAPARAALAAAARDPDALVRLGVARGIAALPPPDALRFFSQLLVDPIRAVRVEAARSLVGSADDHTEPKLREQLRQAVNELIATEAIAAERPESHINLAQIQARLGHPVDAERELRSALRLDPRFVPAMVNLADLYRAENRESEAGRWLRRAVSVAPTAAEPAHALGLLEVRQGHPDAALVWLRKAVDLDAGTARYSYIYAVALSERGRGREALGVVEAARRRAPKDESLRQLQMSLEAQAR
jgi:predicted CXXCH cytochrome family protein